MTISNQRNIHPPLFFKNIRLSETATHKRLGLIFHHSLSWHTHILHLHQKVMTKINRLRSFSNSLPRHSLLTIYKTNILPIFDYGSIIYDNCSDSDKHLLDKAQLSAAKIILGCLTTTSSSDVLLDLNLKTFRRRYKAPRGTGRPKLRYKDVIKRDMASFHISPQSWETLAAGRNRWRASLSYGYSLSATSYAEKMEKRRAHCRLRRDGP